MRKRLSLLSLIVFFAATPLGAQPNDDYTLRFENGGAPGEVTVILDFADGDAVLGYQWGVCHDDTLL